MSAESQKIAALNDALRTTFTGGKVTMTAGVAALPEMTRVLLFQAVQRFGAFSEDNDPHGEHDFGSCDLGAVKFFWKIDYYDKTMDFGSEDPSDPAQTTRVLTIMHASDY